MSQITDTDLLDIAMSRRFCFVGGQGKSGTTWLQLILDAHPQIACSGEGHPADVLAAQLQQAYRNHRQFIEQNNKIFPELTAYGGLSDEDELHSIRAAIALLLARQCQDNVPDVLADRTPANVEHLLVLNRLFPEAIFIHVIRDPRDIAVSLWFHGLRTNPDWIRKRYRSLDNLAIELVANWSRAISAVRSNAAACRERYLEVRYEDLHTRYDDVVTTLFKSLQVDANSDRVRESRLASGFEQVTSGRARGSEDRSSHFRKGVVGDWRNSLDEHTAASIETQFGPTLASLGYGPDSTD